MTTSKINPTILERRKRSLEVLIKEAVIAVVAEQQELADQAAAAPPAPVPASPTPAAPPAGDPAAAPAAAEPANVDTFIDKLNVIRGGSSFSDPEVYGQLTTFWNGLPDDQKASMDTALGSVGKIVAAANQQPAQPDASGSTPPVSTPPAASPAPAPQAPSAPISPSM